METEEIFKANDGERILVGAADAIPSVSKELNNHINNHRDGDDTEVDGTADFVTDSAEGSSSSSQRKKGWTKRPENWMAIAEDAEVHGNMETLVKFKMDFAGMPDSAAYRRLYKWKTDLKNKKPPNYVTRIPTYGKVVDDLLLKDFNAARNAGLSVDDEALRKYLIVHLQNANLENLLIEHGGLNTFGASWAARFCKRHKLGPRKRAARGTKTAIKVLQQRRKKNENGNSINNHENENENENGFDLSTQIGIENGKIDGIVGNDLNTPLDNENDHENENENENDDDNENDNENDNNDDNDEEDYILKSDLEAVEEDFDSGSSSGSESGFEGENEVEEVRNSVGIGINKKAKKR